MNDLIVKAMELLSQELNELRETILSVSTMTKKVRFPVSTDSLILNAYLIGMLFFNRRCNPLLSTIVAPDIPMLDHDSRIASANCMSSRTNMIININFLLVDYCPYYKSRVSRLVKVVENIFPVAIQLYPLHPEPLSKPIRLAPACRKAPSAIDHFLVHRLRVPLEIDTV